MAYDDPPSARKPNPSNTVVPMNDLNSKTKLTEKSQLDEVYNPFFFRDQINGSSTSGSLIHLLKSSLGSGILAMPMAFKNAGLIFGMLGTILAGILCTHCVYILVQTSQKICRDVRMTSLGFSETAEKIFEYGPKTLRPWSNFAKQFVDGALMMTYYAGTTVYIVFIAQSFHDVINYNSGLNLDVRVYVAITMVPLLFLGQIRDLKYLVPFSACANVFIVITFAITLYYMFNERLVFEDKPFVADYKRIPIFFATVVFAMEGIGVVMPVENSMKSPQHFLGCPGVLTTAMAFVVSMYAIIGFFGYVRYGDEALGSITLNLELGSRTADAAKILMALAVLLTYGLQFYVPNEILWKKIKHRIAAKNQNLYQILLRAGIISFSGSIAATIPNLEPFISLVGAIFFSVLGIFVPSLMEIIYLWPNSYGFFKWIFIKDIFLLFLCLGIMFAGSYVSIMQILALYE